MQTQLDNFLRNLKHSTPPSNSQVSPTRRLDLEIYKGPGFSQHHKLDFETHIKPTNPQLHVHVESYHPRTTKSGIIVGETIHLLRTNSRQEMFTKLLIKYDNQITTPSPL